MAEWNVREGVVADASEIQRIYGTLVAPKYLCRPKEDIKIWSVEKVVGLISASNFITTILEMDGVMVGFVMVTRYSSPTNIAKAQVGGIDLTRFTKKKDIEDVSERLISAWQKHLFLAGIDEVHAENVNDPGTIVAALAALNPHIIKHKDGKSTRKDERGNKIDTDSETFSWNVRASVDWYTAKGL